MAITIKNTGFSKKVSNIIKKADMICSLGSVTLITVGRVTGSVTLHPVVLGTI